MTLKDSQLSQTALCFGRLLVWKHHAIYEIASSFRDSKSVEDLWLNLVSQRVVERAEIIRWSSGLLGDGGPSR